MRQAKSGWRPSGRRDLGRSRAIGFELGATSRVDFAVGGQVAPVDLYLYNEWGRRLAPGPGTGGDDLTATLLEGAYCLHAVTS